MKRKWGVSLSLLALAFLGQSVFAGCLDPDYPSRILKDMEKDAHFGQAVAGVQKELANQGFVLIDQHCTTHGGTAAKPDSIKVTQGWQKESSNAFQRLELTLSANLYSGMDVTELSVKAPVVNEILSHRVDLAKNRQAAPADADALVKDLKQTSVLGALLTVVEDELSVEPARLQMTISQDTISKADFKWSWVSQLSNETLRKIKYQITAMVDARDFGLGDPKSIYQFVLYKAYCGPLHGGSASGGAPR